MPAALAQPLPRRNAHCSHVDGPPSSTLLTPHTQSRLHFHLLGLTAGPSTPGWKQRATTIPSARAAAASEAAHAKETPAAFVNLADAIDAYGKGGHVDIVKIDCEGCEWGVFEDLAANHPDLLSRVGQLAIELHAYHPIPGAPLALEPGTPSMTTIGVPAPFTAPRLQTFASHVMGRHGFSIMHRHLNLASLLKDNRFHRVVASAIESERPRPEGWGRAHLWSYWEILLQRKGKGTL
jgi:hypothetical protein